MVKFYLRLKLFLESQVEDHRVIFALSVACTFLILLKYLSTGCVLMCGV